MPINKLPTLALESNAITADLIASGAITAADISDGEITAAKLHTTLDFSTKTFTMHNNHVTQAMVTQHQAALSVTQSQISDLSTTTDLTEGSNLYFTNARADARIAAATTTDLTEGTNLYFTNARADARIAAADTDDLSEGSTNLYFTNARADARAQLKIDALVDSAPNTLDTLNELAAALGDDANFSTTVTNSIAAKLPLAGGTMTGNVSFGDNDKAVFGGLLEIYGDGTHARIREYGSGQMKIQGDNMQLLTSAGTSTYLEGNASTGAVTLYHLSNAPRISTTATGVDVNGGISTGGVSAPTSSDTGNVYVPSGSTLGFQTHSGNIAWNGVFNSGWKYIASNVATLINGNNSGLSFYTAASGTAGNALTWDEKFTIHLDGYSTTRGRGFTVDNSDATWHAINIAESIDNRIAFRITPTRQGQTKGISMGAIGQNTTDTGLQAYDTSDNSANSFLINPWGGNVGIGTSSAGQKFQVYIDNSNDLEYGYRDTLIIDRLSDENMDDASSSVPADRYWPQGNLKLADGNVFNSDSNGPGLSFYKHRDNSGNEYVQAFIGSRGVFGSNNTDLRFYVNTANAANLLPTSPQMLISGANGYVGIGTTTPGAGLEVYGAGSNDRIAIKYSGTSGGHQSGIIFKDFRNQVNAAVFNNLQNDAVGNAAANLELHTSTGGTLSPRIKIFHNGRVAIGDITPDAQLHVNGAGIIGSNNNQATTPIAGLHVIDNVYSHWSSTLSKQQVALRVETYWNASAGQRNTGKYGSGIGFNHLGGHSATHDENVHGWIGLRVVDTPGHERSALVFATNNDTTDEDAGILERASISPEGRFTFKQFSTNSSQIHNSVGYTDLYKFSFSMNMMGNQAYVIRTSGHGNGILRIMAQGSHWSSPYGLWRESYCMLDSSSTISESNMHNQTSSQQGSWSFSRHSASEIDIVKAAGTYAGGMLTNIIIYSPRVVNVVGVY